MRGSRDRERRPYSNGGAHAAEIWPATTQRQRRRAAAVALAAAVLRLRRWLVRAGSGIVQRLRADRSNGECSAVVLCRASSGTALSATSAAAASFAAFAAAVSATAAAAASNLGRLFPPTSAIQIIAAAACAAATATETAAVAAATATATAVAVAVPAATTAAAIAVPTVCDAQSRGGRAEPAFSEVTAEPGVVGGRRAR